jgi:hypothetical protein
LNKDKCYTSIICRILCHVSYCLFTFCLINVKKHLKKEKYKQEEILPQTQISFRSDFHLFGLLSTTLVSRVFHRCFAGIVPSRYWFALRPHFDRNAENGRGRTNPFWSSSSIHPEGNEHTFPGGVATFQFLPPNLEKFDGFSDLTVHLENFNYHMSLLGVTSALKCRIFATTLKHHAIKWLFSLPLNPSMTLRIFPQSFWIDLL